LQRQNIEEFVSWRIEPCKWKKPIVAAHYIKAEEMALMLDITTGKWNGTCQTYRVTR
jgi:hypothetical protein